MKQVEQKDPQTIGQPGFTEVSSGPEPGQAKPGWIRSRLMRFYEYRQSHKEHPFLAMTLAGLVLLVGFVSNDAYTSLKGLIWKKTDHLTELAEEQRKAFADLRADLGQISSSISEGDRAAFRSVRSAVEAIENTNAGLIQQLVLAKQENETLRKASQQAVGVSGGYDFILAERSGVRLDATTVLGVTNVAGGYVGVNLTSAKSEKSVRESLQSGESIAYSSASGQACKVSLLSVNNADIGTASFAIGCT